MSRWLGLLTPPSRCDRDRSRSAWGGTLVLLCFASLIWATPAVAQRYYSDEEVRRMIIDDSMRFFPSCPCPYSYAANGRQCAGDSAYSKLGRSGPLCYPADVSHQDVIYYRQRVLNR